MRGLDYYNRTVFEWVTDQLGAQGTVCAGGRYDGLVEQLGGKPAPACGFAMGIERLLALMEVGADAPSRRRVAGRLHRPCRRGRQRAMPGRLQPLCAARDGSGVTICGGGSFKSQMKKADASGARYALIVGDDEAAAEQVTLKALREEKRADRASDAWHEIAETMQQFEKARSPYGTFDLGRTGKAG